MEATDVVMILGAIGVLITAITSSIVSLRRIDHVKTVIQEDVKAVHKIVNQQRSDMLAYQADLIKALRAGGVDVPKDESL